MWILRVMLVALASLTLTSAFVPCPAALSRPTQAALGLPSPPTVSRTGHALSMGWGDALGKAFANEDMGAAKNPGLKNTPNKCMVTVNGKTVQAVQGQRLRDVVLAARAKIEYGCEKGDCGTCESIVDGRKIRICKAIVPRNKTSVNIKTKFG